MSFWTPKHLQGHPTNDHVFSKNELDSVSLTNERMDKNPVAVVKIDEVQLVL